MKNHSQTKPAFRRIKQFLYMSPSLEVQNQSRDDGKSHSNSFAEKGRHAEKCTAFGKLSVMVPKTVSPSISRV